MLRGTLPQDKQEVSYTEEETSVNDSFDEVDRETEMIAIDAIIDIRKYDVEVMKYFELSLDERAALWDLSKYDEALGFEAYRKLVKTIKPEWSVSQIHEEYKKHMAKCEEFKEEPWMRLYYIDRLKNNRCENDKVLVRAKHPHVR